MLYLQHNTFNRILYILQVKFTLDKRNFLKTNKKKKKSNKIIIKNVKHPLKIKKTLRTIYTHDLSSRLNINTDYEEKQKQLHVKFELFGKCFI